MSSKLEENNNHTSADESQTFQLEALRQDKLAPDPERTEYIVPVHSDGEEEEEDDRQNAHNAPLLLQQQEATARSSSLSGDDIIRPIDQDVHVQEKISSSSYLPSFLRPIWTWIQGPSHPRTYKITPLFERWQTAPGRIIDRYFPRKKRKILLLLAVLGFWGFVFISVVDSSVRSDDVLKISCSTRLW